MCNISQIKHSLNKHPHYLRMLFLLGCVALIFALVHEFELYLPDVEKKIQDLGAFAFLAFIVLFVVLTPFFISVDTLCFVAGLLFPLLPGMLYVAIATYFSAALMFVLGRFLFRQKVKRILLKYPRFAKLDNLLAQHELKMMLLLRLLPLPFALLSYAFSVTHVQFRAYLIATSGILIYNMALVYMGYTTKHVVAAMSGTPSVSLGHYVMLGLIGGITLILLFLGVRKARAVMMRIAPELVESGEH